MTASHMFYNGKVIDISVNYEEFKKNGKDIPYEDDMEDPGFKSVLECIALGSKATFSYKPAIEDIKTYIAKQRGVKATTLEHV